MVNRANETLKTSWKKKYYANPFGAKLRDNAYTVSTWECYPLWHDIMHDNTVPNQHSLQRPAVSDGL